MHLHQLYESKTLESYPNWVFPSDATMKEDFEEFQKKESRWEVRARSIQAPWPMFADFKDFKEKLEKAEEREIGKEFADLVNNMSLLGSVKALKSLVATYYKPRDVDRIVEGFENGDKIPMPILVKGKKGYWILSGNTRSNTAFIQGYKPKVLIIDLTEITQDDTGNRPLEVTKKSK